MSVYSDPERHAANPPETWQVVKAGDRAWKVVDLEGTILERTETKREALEAIESGSIRRLYDRETRWYAGETISGWKPWAQVLAERQRNDAWQALRRPEPMNGGTQLSLFTKTA